jgi:hypothetical protein
MFREVGHPGLEVKRLTLRGKGGNPSNSQWVALLFGRQLYTIRIKRIFALFDFVRNFT